MKKIDPDTKSTTMKNTESTVENSSKVKWNKRFTYPKSVRSLQDGQRHYDVQILGGIALHNGKIAEMKTGEGKTLVSTLSAYLNAISGLGVHIVTVNDYLASRDSEWMGAIYKFLGLSVGCIKSVSYTHLTLPTKRIV